MHAGSTWADIAMDTEGAHAGVRYVEADATSEERTYAMLVHLTLILYHVIPLLVVAPLVMWLIKRESSPFIDDHGKEAVNFHITLVIYALLSLVLTPACGVGLVLMLGVYVLGIVGMILGAVAAHRAEYFRYPMCIRLIP